jgi:hypothetical protein
VLAKDYERSLESSEAMIQVAMIRLMLARLAREHQAQSQRTQQQPSSSVLTAHSAQASLIVSQPERSTEHRDLRTRKERSNESENSVLENIWNEKSSFSLPFLALS